MRIAMHSGCRLVLMTLCCPRDGRLQTLQLFSLSSSSREPSVVRHLSAFVSLKYYSALAVQQLHANGKWHSHLQRSAAARYTNFGTLCDVPLTGVFAIIQVSDLECQLKQAQEQLAELPALKVHSSLVVSRGPSCCCYYIGAFDRAEHDCNAESPYQMQLCL